MNNFDESRNIESISGVPDCSDIDSRILQKEPIDVFLADRADRIQICCAAIVLGEISAKSLVHVGGAQHKQSPRAQPLDSSLYRDTFRGSNSRVERRSS